MNIQMLSNREATALGSLDIKHPYGPPSITVAVPDRFLEEDSFHILLEKILSHYDLHANERTIDLISQSISTQLRTNKKGNTGYSAFFIDTHTFEYFRFSVIDSYGP